MIDLSNGHSFEYVVASGALAFDGYGWPWERPFVWMGKVKPQLFTVVLKTLTRHPRPGNLRWWKPWSCVRLLPESSVVNKVGLTNPGIDRWCKKIGKDLEHSMLSLVGSIYGTRSELVEMTKILNQYNLVGIEVNASCPNTGHPMDDVQAVVDDVKAVRDASRVHPIIVKVSVAQDYCEIVSQLEDVAEAVALNSVPWDFLHPSVRPSKRSPLWRLEKKVGGGGGGVSGKLAQKHNWRALVDLSLHVHAMPVIAPSIMRYEDILHTRQLGARAFSFGAIHIRTPWKPTQIVERRMAEGWPGTRDSLLELMK